MKKNIDLNPEINNHNYHPYDKPLYNRLYKSWIKHKAFTEFGASMLSLNLIEVYMYCDEIKFKIRKDLFVAFQNNNDDNLTEVFVDIQVLFRAIYWDNMRDSNIIINKVIRKMDILNSTKNKNYVYNKKKENILINEKDYLINELRRLMSQNGVFTEIDIFKMSKL